MDKKPRLIDADALISYLRGRLMKEVYPDWEYIPSPTKNRIGKLGEAFRDAIQQAPTIEAEPVRHGRWEYDLGDNIPYCNKCAMPQDVPTNYCHSCGAKMDGGKENDRE